MKTDQTAWIVHYGRIEYYEDYDQTEWIVHSCRTEML